MASKRLTKQEIREDRVMIAANQAMGYAKDNARVVLAVGGVLAIAVIAVVLFTQGRIRGERQASQEMFQAQSLYFGGNFAQAATQFQSVADRYGSAAAAREARLMEANSQLQAGNPTAAEQAFRKFLGEGPKDPTQEAAAHRGLGGSLADEQKFSEAADEFAKAAGITGDPLAAEDWLESGRLHLQAGQKDQAARSFQSVLDNFPQSASVNEARIRLKETLAR